MLRTVQFVNGLRPSNNGLFVNGFILATVPTVTLVPSQAQAIATRSHVHELDIVAPHFKSFVNMESLAWQVLQVTQVRTPPLTSDYPRQAQSCLFVNALCLLNLPVQCACTYARPIQVMVSMPTGLHCLLVGGIAYQQDTTVKCMLPAMPGSVTEPQSHDEGTCIGQEEG